MKYKDFTNKQLAEELQYMPYLTELSPSEFDLVNVIIGRLKISVIQIPPQPKKKSRKKKNAKL